MILGIDYSINSPGLCLFTGNSIEFGTLARDEVCGADFKELLNSYNVFTRNYSKYCIKKNSILDERGFTVDAVEQAEKLIQIAKEMGFKPENAKNNIVVFEGFSFGSKGNRLAQLAGYQFVARALMIKELTVAENLFVFSPQTVKSIAGAAKRGQDKKDMIQRFLDHENKIPGLENHPFYIEIQKNEKSLFRKKGTKRKPVGDWIKPVDDIIDAYWIVYTYLKKESKTF